MKAFSHINIGEKISFIIGCKNSWDSHTRVEQLLVTQEAIMLVSPHPILPDTPPTQGNLFKTEKRPNISVFSE